jgi:hypothetical protein
MRTQLTGEKKFQPIYIVLETPDDAVKFFTILSMVNIISPLDMWDQASEIREAIKENLPNVLELYPERFSKLQDSLRAQFLKEI